MAPTVTLLLTMIAPAAVAADSDALIGQAVDAWNAGDPATAKKLLTEALAAEDRVDAHLLRGQVSYEMGQHEAARKELSAAFAGSEWKTLVDRGRAGGRWAGVEQMVWEAGAVLVLAQLDSDPKAARKTMDQVRAADGDGALLAFAEVQLLVGEGKDAAAAEVLEKARARWPEDANLAEVARGLEAKKADWSTSYNAAVDAFNAEEWSRCLEVLEPVATADPKTMALGHSCAVRGGDLAMASKMLEAAGAPTLPPDQVLLHVDLLSQQEDPQGALTLLQQTTGGSAGLRDTLQVRLLGELGRLDEAASRLGDPDVDPKAAYNIAALLVNADRLPEANEALTIVCPRLQGNAQDSCRQLQSQVASRLP